MSTSKTILITVFGLPRAIRAVLPAGYKGLK